MEKPRPQHVHDRAPLLPRRVVSLVIAVATTFLSERYGGPVMLFALLLGMAFYFLSQEGACVAVLSSPPDASCGSPSGSWARRSPSGRS